MQPQSTKVKRADRNIPIGIRV